MATSSRLLASWILAMAVPAVMSAWLLLVGLSTTIGALVSAVMLTGASVTAFIRSDRQPKWPALPKWHAALLVAPLVLPGLVQVGGAWLKPEASVDGLLYHGPAMANILQKGSLFGWESANQYLYFSDLQMVLAALWARVTDTVMLEDAIQAPYFGLAVLALYVASSVTSRNQVLRMWLALLVVVTPVMWTQGRVLYVDVAAAALFIAGVAMAMTAWRARVRWGYWVSCIAIGASVATKPSALFAGIACFAVVLMMMISTGRVRTPLVGTLAFLLTASPFYLRNLVSFDNPFYPVATDVGPIQFPGLVDGTTFTSSGSLIDPARVLTFFRNIATGVTAGTPRWLYDPREGGFDRTPVLLLAAVAVSALVLLLVARGRSPVVSPDLAWWLLPVAALLSVSVQPNPADSRYVIGAYLCLSAALIGLLSIIPEHVGTGLLLTVPVVVLVVLVTATAEVRMLFGIPESLRLRTSDPEYNTGLDGSTVAYGDRYAWLQDGTCDEVLVQTHGGLGPAGMPAEGLLSTYSYGSWGDHLCNDVTFVPTPDLQEARGAIQSPSVRGDVRTADFIILKTDSRDIWRDVVREEGRTATEVARIESTEYFPISESVWRLS